MLQNRGNTEKKADNTPRTADSGARKEYRELAERQLTSEEIFDGSMLHLFLDSVSLPDGKTAKREYIKHVGAVAVLPLTDDGYAVIERQFRYPVDRVITEIPAGKLNSSTEDRLEAAKRELREETGITASEWINMGDFVPSAAYCNERITLYLARGLRFGERDLDEDEFLNVFRIPFSDLVRDVMSGKITDGKTQAAVLKAALLTGFLSEKESAGK